MNSGRLIILGIVVLTLVTGTSISQVSRQESDFIYATRLFEDELYDLAAEALQAYIANYPDSPHHQDAMMLIGRSLFADSLFEEARTAFQQISLEYPESDVAIEAMVKVADCYDAMNMPERTARALLRIPVFHPESVHAPASLLRAAQILVDIGNLEDAESPLQQILHQYQDFARYGDAQFLWARVRAGRGEWEDAALEAERISHRTIDAALAARALVFAGKWWDQIGRGDEAERVWRKVVDDFQGTESLPEAMTCLGTRLMILGDIEAAQTLFTEALESELSAESAYAAHAGLGDILFIQGNYNACLGHYRLAGNPEDSIIRFKVALCFEFSGNLEYALEGYSLVSQSNPDSLHSAAYWRMGQIYRQMEDHDEAVDAFLACEDASDDTLIKAEARYNAVLVSLENNPERSFNLSEDYDVMYPLSPYIDDVKYLTFQALLDMSRFQEAVSLAEVFSELYPLSPLRTDLSRRADIIRLYEIRNSDPSAEVASLLAEVAGGLDTSELALRLGEIYLNDYKDYNRAIQQFERILGNENSDEQKRRRAEQLLIESLWRRIESRWSRIDTQTNELPVELLALTNETIEAYETMLPEFTGDAASNIAYKILQLELRLQEGEERCRHAREGWRRFLATYAQSNEAADATFELGMAFTEWLPEDNPADTVQPAIYFLNTLVTTYPEYPRRNEALLLLGDTYASVGEIDSTIRLYREVAETEANPEKIQALVRLLPMPELPFSERIDMMEYIQSEAFYHPDAELIRTTVANLLVEMEAWEEAENQFRELTQRRQPGDPGFLILGTQRNQYLFSMGQIYEGLGNIPHAKRSYLSYIAHFPDSPEAADARLRLARINMSEHNDAEAIRHFTILAEDSLVIRSKREESYRSIARIHFVTGSYAEARNKALRVVEITENPDTSFEYSQLAIVCLYRQGQLEEARTEARQLRRAYSDRADLDNVTARFHLERGRWFSQHRNYEEAEEQFRRIIERFEGSSWVAAATYELGQDFLLQNMHDQGVETLQRIIDLFPDNPILGLVYLTLGNHYISVNRLMDGVAAYEQVLNNDQYYTFWPQVFNNQIQAYKQAGFYAGAVRAIEEYLRRYPQAEDTFAKQMELGRMYMSMEQYDLAIAKFTELKPYADVEEESECQFYIAESFDRQGRFTEAIIEYMKVDYLGRNTRLEWAITALYNAGQCYERLGNNRRAEELYRQIVIREGLGSPFGRAAQQQIDRLTNTNNR